MSASPKTGLGIHFSMDGVRASFAADGRITQLPLIASVPDFLTWLRLPGGRLACLPAPEVMGVEGKDHEASKALLEVFRRLKESLPPQAGQPQVAIAVPRALAEPQRRRLLNAAQDFFGQASLIDSTTAALHALPATTAADVAATTVAVVAEEAALEMSLAATEAGGYRILGYRHVPELSMSAFCHHLFQLVIDRLPAAMQERMATADEDTLSKLLSRTLRTRSMLSRLDSVTCPMVELDSPPPNVSLAAKDITAWLDPRLASIGAALDELARENGTKLDRVLIVGGWGEWPAFLSRFEGRFESPLVYGLVCVADGAALAAAGLPLQHTMRAIPGPLTPMNDLVARCPGFVSLAPPPANRAQSTEAKIQALMADIAQLVAEQKYAPVQKHLGVLKRWTESVLAAIEAGPPPAGIRGNPAPLPQGASPEFPAADSFPGNEPMEKMPAAAKRCFDDAERYLRSGRILEAVGSSHLGHQEAPGSHPALLQMLDVHRRAAKMLADAGDYVTAESQLRCALQHRQSDERTRRDLGQLLLTHAAIQEKDQQNFAEATRLYEEALDLVDDDATAEVVQRLQHLEELTKSRG